MKIGFHINPFRTVKKFIRPVSEPPKPIRTLVQVRFEGDGRVLTYYNDRFHLKPGDRVFVSGRLAGKPGIVESITTKFKINLANYEKVISVASLEIHGTYERIIDKMVSYDSSAVSAAQFRSWCMPPENENDEIVAGDGYEISLEDLSSPDEIKNAIFDRALGYCRDGSVAYISISGGVGTAFIHGTEWYEVNFLVKGSHLTEMYCSCPYPGLCKHLLAVSIILKSMIQEGLDIERDFVAIDDSCFWQVVSRTVKEITF